MLAEKEQDCYNYRPDLLETFVQTDLFAATCYKAANWIRLGATSGYSLYGSRQSKVVTSKAVYVYPMAKKFRTVPCGSDNGKSAETTARKALLDERFRQ